MKNIGSHPPQSTPDEEHLIALLSSLRPRPTARFYRRMAAAPWRVAAPRRWFEAILAPRRLLAAGIVILLVAVLAGITTPALQAVARQFARFFAPNPGESMVLQVTIPSPSDPGVFGSPGYFSLSLAQAKDLAGFDVNEIRLSEADTPIPGLEFAGAHYDPDRKTVVLRYAAGSRSLFFTQRLSGTIQEFSSIGSNAPVEIVRVRGVEGEYVTGGWKKEPTSDAFAFPGTPQPGTQVSLDVIWDPALPQHILRWQEGNLYYEILVSAALGRYFELEKEDLIHLSESIQ